MATKFSQLNNLMHYQRVDRTPSGRKFSSEETCGYFIPRLLGFAGYLLVGGSAPGSKSILDLDLDLFSAEPELGPDPDPRVMCMKRRTANRKRRTMEKMLIGLHVPHHQLKAFETPCTSCAMLDIQCPSARLITLKTESARKNCFAILLILVLLVLICPVCPLKFSLIMFTCCFSISFA